MLAAWNALTIRALVDAADALDEPRYLRRAESAARFILKQLMVEGGALRRSHIAGQAREQGVLDDYAFLADALLALHAATGAERWRAAARRLADVMIERFEDTDAGGFFLTSSESTLFVRPKPFDDGALPSGNGVALGVLRVLAATTGVERYAGAARRAASAATPGLNRSPRSLATMVAVLANTPEPPPGAVTKPPTPDAAPSQALGMPRSQDHVKVFALRRPGEAGFTVKVSMDEGWHVNANPASTRFLIPTSVEIPGDGAGAKIRYPEGHSFHPEFAPEPISVYEGTVEIVVEFENGGTPPERIGVRYQACDESRCLAPHREELSLESAAP